MATQRDIEFSEMLYTLNTFGRSNKENIQERAELIAAHVAQEMRVRDARIAVLEWALNHANEWGSGNHAYDSRENFNIGSWIRAKMVGIPPAPESLFAIKVDAGKHAALANTAKGEE